MTYEALDSLRETLNQILKNNPHPEMNREMISIHYDTVFLQLHLANNPESLEEGIREAANTTKEIIEYLFSEDFSLLHGGPSMEHLKQLRKAAEKLKSTGGDGIELKDTSPSVSSPPRTATISRDIVVGFDEDVTIVKNRLTGYHPSKLQVVSMVGIGGSGKTTLAKLVYNDRSIVNHFDIRAWVTVSQDYSVASILANLLASLGSGIPVPAAEDVEGEISTESLIRRHLERGSFLIVFDDMCSKKAWDDLMMLFSVTHSRGRIMLTTRLHDVATYVDSSSPHMMRLLDANHSWNLLKEKVFADESCPLELEDVGKKIVKNCGGLPLSIVVVAGILSKVPKTRDSWKQIAANDGDLETIISQSYNYLPDYMRPCFLYMGGFPEDYEIRMFELTKLWVAEGFLKGGSCKSLEKEAEECLENLVERSLVLVSSRKSDGKIKSCSVHDIVRDFCVKQGEQEKFFLSVVDYLPNPILRRHFLPGLLKNHGRISVTWNDLDLKDCVHASCTHSIICIPQRGYMCVGSVQKFSSLRVFHVLRRNDHWDWEAGQVYDLIYLTYLAYNIPTSIIPPAISKLQNLQTLIIYRSEVRLPVEIWRLRQLRHLMAFSFDSLPRPRMALATLPLEKLETMSLVTDFVCDGRMVKMIPNIKKLGICYFMDKFDAHYHLDNLKHLRQLEKLKMEGRGRFSFGIPLKILELMKQPPRGFLERLTVGGRKNPVFPVSLKKLTLCGWGIPWEDMTVIGSLPNLQVLKLRNYALPNLQVLKLRNYAFSGEFWETTEGEFGELRHLLIDGSNLKYWSTARKDFPRLQCLVLLNCPYLFEIPYSIGRISTLKLVEVDAMRGHFFQSVKDIEETKMQFGRENFQVRLKKRS